MIFPGMDPYLEDPRLWPGVHACMIVYISDYLQPLLQPRYLAAIEQRVYLHGMETARSPDLGVRRQKKGKKTRGAVATLEADQPIIVTVTEAETRESYVTILDKYADEKLVTVLEVVSPTNKFAGPGRESYRAKQSAVLNSDAHLVEIDLLRAGPHVVAVPEASARGTGPYHYLACVNRAREYRNQFDLYPVLLEQRLPRIKLPLAGADPDVALDMQAVLAQTYEQGRYRERLAYDKPCQPPLSRADQAWAKRLLSAAANPPTRANGAGKTRKTNA